MFRRILPGFGTVVPAIKAVRRLEQHCIKLLARLQRALRDGTHTRLVRKRLLKYEQTVHEEGVEFWHMRLTRDQSLQAIVNPRMTDDQIAVVSAELGAILHGDSTAFERFDADASATEPDASAPDSDTDVE